MNAHPRSPDDHVVPDASGWWHQTVAAALVGTARRPVPRFEVAGAGVAPRTDGGPEVALLDAAALGSVMLTAGAVCRPVPPGRPGTTAPAPPESRAEAPARANQLLSLVLEQNPAGTAALEPLVRRWCTMADRHRYRLPHALLPQVLELGRTRPGLRTALAPVLGERGAWLADQLPGAGWVAGATRTARTARAAGRGNGAEDPHDPDGAGDRDDPGLPDPMSWAQLGDAERLAALRTARRHDPALGRALVESTWPTDPARTRRAHLEELQTGLGDADEDLLERALDDRAAGVRAAAASLLDGLPGSARAGRMADRLRPLLHLRRSLLHSRLEVDLPQDPDPAGVRDGLGPAPHGTSARASWLVRLAAGAPLSVWTGATGKDPEATYALISSEEAREGIREAVLRRKDREWARAVARLAGAGHGSLDAALVELLEPAEAERLVLLRADAGGAAFAAVVQAAPPGWSQDLTLGVVERCRRAAARRPADVVAALRQLLARAADLHPDALPVLHDWLVTDPPAEPAQRLLRDLVQQLSLYQSIEEALAP